MQKECVLWLPCQLARLGGQGNLRGLAVGGPVTGGLLYKGGESMEIGTMEPKSVPPETQAAMGRRLSVNVALDVGAAIDELAKRHNTTITDVIRRAVSVAKYIDDETRNPHAKILIERDGVIREVNFLW